LLALAAVAAGCGTRAHQQALTVAKRYAAAHGLSGAVACSNGIGGMHPRSPDFICDVRHSETDCDELSVRRYEGSWHVVVRRRGVDCVLPA
jgi:hypothetical protein